MTRDLVLPVDPAYDRASAVCGGMSDKRRALQFRDGWLPGIHAPACDRWS